MDPEQESPPEPDKTESKAQPNPPVDGASETKRAWTRMIPASATGDSSEPELPLVTPAFDPLTEPELPLQGDSATAPPAQPESALGTGAIEATVETQPEIKDEAVADAVEPAQTTSDSEPKPALPMQKSNPGWAQTDPAADEPAAEQAEDQTEPRPAVPMQKPAPAWAQTVPAPADSAGEPQPTPPAEPARSEPLTWPPKAHADTGLPTQSDIWPPEPPTEHTMPAWPPSAFGNADAQLPDLPAGPTPSEWAPPPVSARGGSPASTASTSNPGAAPATASPAAKTIPPATTPPATVPPGTVPPATVTPSTVPPAATVPPAPVAAKTIPPATKTAPPATKTVPPATKTVPPATKTVPPASATPETWPEEAAIPAAAVPPAAQGPLVSTPKPVAEPEPATFGEPQKTASPSWAPNIAAPAAAAPDEATDWPGTVDVPAWAPQIHIAPVQPRSPTRVPEPAAPAAAKPPAPVAPAQPAPIAPAHAEETPAAETPASGSAWQVVAQKPVREVNIKRLVPTPEDRSYAEWFTWAKRGGAPVGACHSAAQAAFQALSTGKDVAVAAQMAAAAMVNPPLPVDSGRQTYCAWFALANIDLNLDQARAHAFSTAAVHALDAGADAKGAHAAGLEAAGIK